MPKTTKPADDGRRALRLLNDAPDGHTEAAMRAHGFSAELLGFLVEAGLATAHSERTQHGRWSMVVRLRITDAGRKVLG